MTRSVLVIVHVFVSIWQSPMYLVKHERVERCKVPCEKFMVPNGGSDGEGIPLIRGPRATRRNTPKTISKWGRRS